MKRCARCGVTKAVEEFNWKVRALGKRQSRCKDCQRVDQAEWRAGNREYHLARQRDWYRANAAAQQERRDALVEWRAGWNARLNAQRRGVTVAELVSPLVVLELHDGVCGICGEDVDPLAFEVDHIVPIATGGFHTLENLQPAHPACNGAKGAESQAAA